MSWQFYTAPKQPGGLVTNKDSQELFLAFIERIRASQWTTDPAELRNGSDDPALRTITISYKQPGPFGGVTTRLLHEAINQISEDFVRQPGPEELYVRWNTSSMDENDLYWVAANDLGIDPGLRDIIHPSGGELLHGSPLMYLHYINICRRAMQLMKTISPPIKSHNGFQKDTEGPTFEDDDWDEVVQEFDTMDEDDWTSPTATIANEILCGDPELYRMLGAVQDLVTDISEQIPFGYTNPRMIGITKSFWGQSNNLPFSTTILLGNDSVGISQLEKFWEITASGLTWTGEDTPVGRLSIEPYDTPTLMPKPFCDEEGAQNHGFNANPEQILIDVNFEYE